VKSGLVSWCDHPHTQEETQERTQEFQRIFVFASLETFMPKRLDKDAVKILKLSWRIRNALFVRVVVLQTKYCISNKFLINLGSMSKTFTVNKRCEFCIDTVCHWPPNHCIAAQKIVFVLAAFYNSR